MSSLTQTAVAWSPGPSSSGSGTFPPVTSCTHFTRLYSPPRFVVETMLIFLQSEQQKLQLWLWGQWLVNALAPGFMLTTHIFEKSQVAARKTQWIMIQWSLGNPTAHLGTICHRVRSISWARLFTGALQFHHVKATHDKTESWATKSCCKLGIL